MIDWKDWFTELPCKAGWQRFLNGYLYGGIECGLDSALVSDRAWATEYSHRPDLLRALIAYPEMTLPINLFSLAKNPASPPDVLAWIAAQCASIERSGYRSICRQLIHHPAVTPAILESLIRAKGQFFDVRQEAVAALGYDPAEKGLSIP